jgi:hypothetical protein
MNILVKFINTRDKEKIIRNLLKEKKAKIQNTQMAIVFSTPTAISKLVEYLPDGGLISI